MGGSDNRTGPDEVAQKPWWLGKMKGHDWKHEASIGLHNACLCYCTRCHVNTDREAASDERAARGHKESETQSRSTVMKPRKLVKRYNGVWMVNL